MAEREARLPGAVAEIDDAPIVPVSRRGERIGITRSAQSVGMIMRDEKFDIIKFSSQVRDLLSVELQVAVGNMEVVPFAEKLYKLVRAQAYNEGILDAKRVMERKLSDISEQLDVLLQYE